MNGEGPAPMQLKEVQRLLASSAQGPASAQDALCELQATTERALSHLREGNTAQTQVLLEHGFSTMMAAFHYLNMNLENVVAREQQRSDRPAAEGTNRVILLFSDHAELRVDGELRGTIPLYSPEDYRELRQIAQLFSCRIEQSDHVQLDLFSIVRNRQALPHDNRST